MEKSYIPKLRAGICVRKDYETVFKLVIFPNRSTCKLIVAKKKAFH